MRGLLAASALSVSLLAAPAQSATLDAVVAGATAGGLIGSAYNIGVGATAAAVGSPVTSTIGAVISFMPAVTGTVLTTVSAAPVPVVAGVVAGGATGYALYAIRR